jgi:hypothetical protein
VRAKIGIPKDLSVRRRSIIDEIGLLRVLEFLDFLREGETFHIRRPQGGDVLADRESVARISDRRSEQIGHRQFAEFVVQRVPAIDRARHSHR